MAARYRKIDPRVWNDEGFEMLNPTEKLVVFNILTGQSNRIGLFKFSPALGAEQCGIKVDSYGIAIGGVCKRLGWKYDEARKVLYIPTWWKYNPPENPKHMSGILGDLHDLPETELFKEFTANRKNIPGHSAEAFDRVCHSYAIAMPNQKQEQELEQEQKQEQDVAASAAGGGRRKQPVGPHHELIRHFCGGWEELYGDDYGFDADPGKNGAIVKWALERVGQDLGRAKEIVDQFFADDDGLVVKNRHSLGMLKSSWRRYQVGPPRKGDEGVTTAEQLAAERES